MLWEQPPLIGPTREPQKAELRLIAPEPREVSHRIKYTVPARIESDEWGEWEEPARDEWGVQATYEYGQPQWYWVDQRTGRKLQVANIERPQRAPKLPSSPLPPENREYRRYWPPLDKISRETLRKKMRASGLALVQQSGVQAITSGTTGTVSITATAGNCLILAVGTALNAGSNVVGTPSDTSNLWVTPASIGNTGTGGSRSQWWYANNCVGGTYTITMTLATAVQANWEVYEWSGVGNIASGRSIADALNNSASSGTSAVSTMTPFQTSSLALALVTDGGTATAWTKNASSTSLSQTTTNIDFATAYRVLSATDVSTASVSFTQTGGAVNFACTGIIVRPAGTPVVSLTQTNGSISASSLAVTASANAGELIYFAVYANGQAATATTPTDNTTLGNSYTLVKRLNNPSGGELTLWRTFSTQGGGYTITANFTGTTGGVANWYRVSGVLPSATIESQIVTGIGNSNSISVGPATPTTPNGIALLFMGLAANSIVTPGGSASLYGNGSGAGTGTIVAEGQALGAVGAVTMTATQNNARQGSYILITLNTGGAGYGQSLSSAVSANPGTTTAPFNTAPGDLVVFGVAIASGTTISTVIDNQGNTWHKVGSLTNGEYSDLWYALNIAGGKLAITFTPSSGTPTMRYALATYSGIDPTALADITTTATGSGTTATVTGATPKNLLELAICIAGPAGVNTSMTPTSPMAAVTNLPGSSNNIALGHFTTFSPGAVPSAPSASWTWGAPVSSALVFATFKMAGSGAYTQGITTTNPGQGSDSSTGLLTHSALTSTNAGTGSDASTGKLTHAGVASASGTGSDAATGKTTHAGIATATGTGSDSSTGLLTHSGIATSTGTGTESGTGLVTHKGITSTNAGVGSDAATGKLSHYGVTTTNAGQGSTSATGRLHHYAITVTNPGVGSATLIIRHVSGELPIVTSVAYALNVASTAPRFLNSATSQPFALTTAVTGVDA